MRKFPIGNALLEMKRLVCLQAITFNMYKLEAKRRNQCIMHIQKLPPRS